MPNSDFKREPQATRLARVWRENNGNWLLLTGLLVSLIAWTVGYFNLIPDISASPTKPGSASLMTTGHTLTIRITDCESNSGQVVGMLYAGKSFGETATALRVELLTIENRQAVWHIHNLPFGPYAVVAFHDLNSDEMLQPGVERQGPVARAGPPTDDKPPTYADLVFQFTEDHQETLVELR